MNVHALTVLQFGAVLDHAAGFAANALGARAVRERTPTADRAEIERELARVTAVRALLGSEAGWASQPIPDVHESLRKLGVLGASLDGEELRDVARLLRSSRLSADALGDPRHPAVARSVLAPYQQRLLSDQRAEERVDRAIDDDGSVRDDASPTLRRLRRDLRGAEGALIALLDRIMAKLEPHHRVLDASVTVRNGRYVIPVRREGRGNVGGLVHDTSGSGATVFVEPPAAIEACNRIRELEGEEAHEVDRILRELTEALRPLADPLADACDVLIVLDSLTARARFAAAFGCHGTTLRDPGTGCTVVRGRHPLLVAQGMAVVPFDLVLGADERTLLISGPNTGGKTVLIKALALMSLLVQSGVPAPCEAASEIPVYDDVFADIGDEQSIEASLSTFSAHVKNLGELLRYATARSLVVIDELGSGTDPLEGAALGGAVLEALTTRGVTTVATTHLGALKELATEVPGVVNGSLEFDAVALAPTYRLIQGIPGRSYGLSIARRLQLPADVLERAKARIPTAERDVNALLETLRTRDAVLAQREGELDTQRQQALEQAHRLAERERRLRERERAVEKESRQDARRHLLDARQTIERTIRDLRRSSEDRVDDAAREARRAVETLAERQAERIEQLEREEANAARRTAPRPADAAPLTVGAHVAVLTMEGKVGRVVELRGRSAVVALGSVKMTHDRASLRVVQEPTTPDAAVPMRGDLPDLAVSSEIDIRGHRPDEIEEVVMQSLDAAIQADLRSLRIIHGKGTGVLRERVGEMLRKDTRVRSFRLGAWNEGGAGVTIAEL